MYFSVNTMHKILYEIGMEVWKIVFHSIHSGICSILRNFRSIHSIPWPGCRFYIVIIIATFTPAVVARLKIRKRLI